MRFLSSVVGAALTFAVLGPAVASPPVQTIDPAAQSELIVETKVISVATRAPSTPEGNEITELRCTVTKIVQDKNNPKEKIRVGTQLSVIGECQRATKPLDPQMVGYPSSRCDAGAWTAPFWMKEQKKDQPLTLFLKHAVSEQTKKPIAGKLETVSDRQPGPSPAIVTVAAPVPAKK